MASRTTDGAKLDISTMRAMLIGLPDGDDEPECAIAHVRGTLGGEPISIFGRVEARDPVHEDHGSLESWSVVERLLQRLVEGHLVVGDERVVNSQLRHHLEPPRTQEQVAEQAPPDHSPVQRKSIYRRSRRLARRVVKRDRSRRTDVDPRLPQESLPGIQAIRTALLGVHAHVGGEDEGAAGNGIWFTGESGGFRESDLERLQRYACAPVPAPPSMGGALANTYPDAAYIGELPKDGTKGHLLEREALRYGLETVRYPNGTFVTSDGQGRQLNFKWGRSPIASGVSLSICSYKEATRRLLEKIDIPVPTGRVFAAGDVDDALAYADRIGYPVVCKPVAGLRGIGVVSNIRSRDGLVKALDLYSKSQLGADDFVIEKHVDGQDYRIVVIGGEVVAAVVREPASVVGDGIHTVADLVEYKNRARRLNPHLRTRPITFSDATRYQLAQAGLTYGSVPEAGQKVTLANSANLSQGGDSFEVAHELHPTIRETAVRAVQAVPGLGFCGLDMLIEDHRKPITEQQATVIELNAHAAIGSAQYPMWGTPTPVAKLFFEECARAYGLELPDKRADTLSLRLRIRGRVVGVNYRRWFAHYAQSFGVTGTIQNTGRRTVTATLSGPAEPVSALVYKACQGPRGAIPTSVTVTHIDPVEREGFEIIQ